MEIFLNDSSCRDPRLFDVGAKLDHFTGQIDRTLHGLPSNPIRTLLNRIGRIPWFTNKKKKLLFSFFFCLCPRSPGQRREPRTCGVIEGIHLGRWCHCICGNSCDWGWHWRERTVCTRHRSFYHDSSFVFEDFRDSAPYGWPSWKRHWYARERA